MSPPILARPRLPWLLFLVFLGQVQAFYIPGETMLFPAQVHRPSGSDSG